MVARSEHLWTKTAAAGATQRPPQKASEMQKAGHTWAHLQFHMAPVLLKGIEACFLGRDRSDAHDARH